MYIYSLFLARDYRGLALYNGLPKLVNEEWTTISSKNRMEIASFLAGSCDESPLIVTIEKVTKQNINIINKFFWAKYNRYGFRLFYSYPLETNKSLTINLNEFTKAMLPLKYKILKVAIKIKAYDTYL